MDTATFNCPNCGADLAISETEGGHCGCQQIESNIEKTEVPDSALKLCPRCRTSLSAITHGQTKLHECMVCDGLWISVDAFHAICSDSEKQSAKIERTPRPTSAEFEIDERRYIACPVCQEMMNRMNFVRTSGIMLDICPSHGVWFDRDELNGIIKFIHSGGLDESRKRNLEKFAEEKRKHAMRAVLPVHVGSSGFDMPDVVDVIGCLAEVLFDIML